MNGNSYFSPICFYRISLAGCYANLTMYQPLAPNDFLDLNRLFVPFEQLGNPDADEMWAEILASREEKRDWDWLLSHRVVAVLAEAGSGKS